MLVYWHVSNCCYFIFEFVDGSWKVVDVEFNHQKPQEKQVYVLIHILFKLMAFFFGNGFYTLYVQYEVIFCIVLTQTHGPRLAKPVWVHVKRFTVRTGESFFFLVKINV